MKSEPSPDLQDLPPEMPTLIARLAWGGGTLVTLQDWTVMRLDGANLSQLGAATRFSADSA